MKSGEEFKTRSFQQKSAPFRHKPGKTVVSLLKEAFGEKIEFCFNY